MKVGGRTPCGDCPYRRDAPLGKWDPREFVELEKSDMDLASPMYGCHKKDGTLCRGWVIDQRERDMPNVTLRFHVAMVPDMRAEVAAVRCPVPRWPSIRVMAQANGVADMTLWGHAERVALAREGDGAGDAFEAWSRLAASLPDHVIFDHWQRLKEAMWEGQDDGATEMEGG